MPKVYIVADNMFLELEHQLGAKVQYSYKVYGLVSVQGILHKLGTSLLDTPTYEFTTCPLLLQKALESHNEDIRKLRLGADK